jgi:hypothetical protein
MADVHLQKTYIQGAMIALLEEWDEMIEKHRLQPQFFIKASLCEAHPDATSFPLQVLPIPVKGELTSGSEY